MKKYLHSCFVAITCFLLMFVSVQNVEAMGQIDTSSLGSITIEYDYDDIDLANVNCHIYQVATVSSYGDYTPTEKFKDLPIVDGILSNAEWTQYKNTASVLIDAYLIEPDYNVVTNEKGLASLENLTTGLYIIEFDDVITEESDVLHYIYTSDSVLVSVPSYDEVLGDYSYNQVVSPKVERNEFEVLPYDDEFLEISVNKIWESDNIFNIRPSFVEITLYCDGQVYDVVNLSYEMEWTYTWTDLEVDHTWAVIESKVPDGYMATYEVSNGVHIIKNIYLGDVLSYEDEIPNTGVVLWPMQMFAGVGIFLISAGLITEKRGKHEKKC